MDDVKIEGAIPKPKKVLCPYCKLPIKVEEFGGIINKECYHSACIELHLIADGVEREKLRTTKLVPPDEGGS